MCSLSVFGSGSAILGIAIDNHDFAFSLLAPLQLSKVNVISYVVWALALRSSLGSVVWKAKTSRCHVTRARDKRVIL